MKLKYIEKENCFVISKLKGMQDKKTLSELRFKSSILSKKTLQAKVEFILKHIENHPGIMALLKNILIKGPLTIEVVEHQELGSQADWCDHSRRIRLSKDCSDDDSLNCFVFELCNADNEMLRQVQSRPLNSFKDKTDYAEQMERAEYLTFQRTAKFFAEALQIPGWEKFEGYAKPRTIEEYLRIAKLRPDADYHGFSHFENYEFLYLKLMEIELEARITSAQELFRSDYWQNMYESLFKCSQLAKTLVAKSSDDDLADPKQQYFPLQDRILQKSEFVKIAEDEIALSSIREEMILMTRIAKLRMHKLVQGSELQLQNPSAAQEEMKKEAEASKTQQVTNNITRSDSSCYSKDLLWICSSYESTGRAETRSKAPATKQGSTIPATKPEVAKAKTAKARLLPVPS